MMTDAILGRANPWAELFDPGRKALGRGLWDYVKENADYPYYLIRDRFAGAESRSLRAVKRGQGQVIEHDGGEGRRLPRPDGALTLRSAICTAHGLRRRLEHGRADLGLPVPRLAFQPPAAR